MFRIQFAYQSQDTAEYATPAQQLQPLPENVESNLPVLGANAAGLRSQRRLRMGGMPARCFAT